MVADRGVLLDAAIQSMEEQFGGVHRRRSAACYEFSWVLGDLAATGILQFDHVFCDSAPTGHTPPLLQLPAAWMVFFDHRCWRYNLPRTTGRPDREVPRRSGPASPLRLPSHDARPQPPQGTGTPRRRERTSGEPGRTGIENERPPNWALGGERLERPDRGGPRSLRPGVLQASPTASRPRRTEVRLRRRPIGIAAPRASNDPDLARTVPPAAASGTRLPRAASTAESLLPELSRTGHGGLGRWQGGRRADHDRDEKALSWRGLGHRVHLSTTAPAADPDLTRANGSRT